MILGYHPIHSLRAFDAFENAHGWSSRDNKKYESTHAAEEIHVDEVQNRTTTVLLLNAFEIIDNVSHKRLLHNLRKRGICNAIVNFMPSFIFERQTDLKLPAYTLKSHNIGIGVPQRSSLL